MDRNNCFVQKAILTIVAAVSTSAGLFAAETTYQDYALDTISGRNIMKYHVTAIYSDGTEEDITSSATISYSKEGLCTAKDGFITGKNYGTVDLNFSYGDESDNLSLLVENVEAERTVSSIVFTPSSLNLQIGENTSFTCKAVYKDGHQTDITKSGSFLSDNKKVISVVGDSIISIGKGSANVTVSYQGALGSAVTGMLPVSVIYRDPYKKNEAESFTAQSGVECENLSEADKDVAFIENNDWVEYEGMDFGDNGPATFAISVATPNSGGYIKVYANGVLSGTCAITSTGSWTTWKTFICKMKDVKGVNTLRLVFSGGSGYLFNVNSWYFTEVVSAISSVLIDSKTSPYYTLMGVDRGPSADKLPSGVYIHSGRKVIIKK